MPCDQDVPAFAMGRYGDLWMLILEKAMAKINGCYDGIRTVSTYEAMRDLTGAPSYCMPIRNNAELFPMLINGFENGFVMTVGCSQDNEDPYKMQLF